MNFKIFKNLITENLRVRCYLTYERNNGYKDIRNDGTTIILIEHIMKAVMNLSDRIYVLNQGQLISEGTPSYVSQDPEVIKSYLGERKVD